MREYLLLSGSRESGIGGGLFVADPTIQDRILQHGAVVNGTLVDSVDSAGAIFADLLAKQKFGARAIACVVRRDCSDENCAIFEMTPGTPHPGGGHYLEEEIRFAVKIVKR
jgi:hypothetical protein